MRALAVGRRGRGKTNRLRCAARALLAARPDLVCVYHDVAKPNVQYPGLVVATVANIPRAAEAYWKRTGGAKHGGIVPREFVVRRDSANAVAAFALGLPACIVVLDELKHRSCLGAEKQVPENLGDILFYGTTVDVLGTTQVLVRVRTELPSLCDVLWVHHLSSDIEGEMLRRNNVPPAVIADALDPRWPQFAYHTVYL